MSALRLQQTPATYRSCAAHSECLVPECPLFVPQRHHGIDYSYLSATMGSTLAARRAGMKLASRPIVKRVLAAVAKVIGSRGFRPNSKLSPKRALIHDRSRPVTMPMQTTASSSRLPH